MTPSTRTSPHEPPLQFTPKLISQLREGYGLTDLRADVMAGLTVAIVALPLSMAIAIASGVGPERGLYTAIVGGFLVSALGGSRFQIGGPAGAFIVLVAACVADIGVEGLLLATLLSGGLLALIGLLRLGTYIRFIPYPVTVGFTAGIGVIIFSSQIKDLLGLSLTGREPSDMLSKLPVLWDARATISLAACAIAAGTIATILGLRRINPAIPGMLIAVVVASGLAAVLNLPVETIHSRFGDLPRVLPWPALPTLSAATIGAALPYAASFALLGAIESLLSAVVADGMSGRRHRPNIELLAQGAANVASALFGGFCVTGTIARTATNVRAGSHGPVSGMLHSVFVLLFMLLAAPLAGYIPLAALGGVLAVVSLNMIEWHALRALVRTSRGDAVVLVTTFLLVVFRDLTDGIVVGFALAGLLFIKRMSDRAQVERPASALAGFDPMTPQGLGSGRDHVAVYHIRGVLFFGAVASLSAEIDASADAARHLVVDLSDVPFIDSTAANAIGNLAAKVARLGGQLYLTGVGPDLRRNLSEAAVAEPSVRFRARVGQAVDEALATTAPDAQAAVAH